MAQRTVQVGLSLLTGVQPQAAADPAEEFPTRLQVEFMSQHPQLSGDTRTVVKKQVRSVQAHIIHPTETLGGAAHIGRHGAKHLTAESIVGIGCGHRISTSFKRLWDYFTRKHPR